MLLFVSIYLLSWKTYVFMLLIVIFFKRLLKTFVEDTLSYLNASWKALVEG